MASTVSRSYRVALRSLPAHPSCSRQLISRVSSRLASGSALITQRASFVTSAPRLESISRTYATSTTSTSSPIDPAEQESQRLLDEGTNYLETGDMDKAKEFYKKSLQVKETSSAYFNMGVCYYHERNLKDAIQAWNDSLRLSPENSDAHNNLASAYALSKPPRPDLAVDHLKSATSIAPEDPEIQYNLAAVLEACEQLEEALTAYKRALDGGVQRAEQNIRNCSAKLLSAKFAIQQQQQE